MLGKLCTVYGWTLSRLMAEAETRAPNLVPARDQAEWKDPESGYRRRIVSPPMPGVSRRARGGAHARRRVGLVRDLARSAGLEHHLWMLEGTLTLDVEGSPFWLRAGDCLRYVLAGPTRFKNPGKRGARYVVAMVRP